MMPGNATETRRDEGERSDGTAATRPKPALKDLYELGELPPLGHVPANMYAWTIRRERHGPPRDSFQVEVVPTWSIGEEEVLLLEVMAGGVSTAASGPASASRSRPSTSTRARCISPAPTRPASSGLSAPR